MDQVLRWVVTDFEARSITSSRLDAELLLGLAIGCSRLELFLNRNRVLSAEELARYRGLVARRRAHEPVAYVLGEREFYGHRFRVDRRVLIPRPDTETLVDVALRRTNDRSMCGRLLDVCTGTGCVAIAFALARPTWCVMATDCSAEALTLARENALRLGAVWNTGFRHGDLLDAAPRGAMYDVVTANPPYIPTPAISELDPTIRDYEPRVALDGGPDGLDFVRRIVSAAPACLHGRGLLAIEVGCDQAEAAQQLLLASGMEGVQVDLDLGKRPRVVSGIRPA